MTIPGLFIAMFGPMLVAGIGKQFNQPPGRLIPHLCGLAAVIMIVASVLWIVFRYERQSLSSIGVQPLRWQSVIWGFSLAAFFIFLFAPAADWMLGRLQLGSFDIGIAKHSGLPVWYLIIAVVVGGVGEEILYRGYAVERIAMLTGSYWIGGAVSVLIFGIAHVSMWGWGARHSLRLFPAP